MWPPAPEFSRKTTEECVIDGVFIPKNTWICVSPFVSGHDPKNFPNPDSFVPERFMKDDSIAKENNVTSYTFFPFSLGPRNCIGQNFAQIEGKVFLAKFIQNFDFKLDPNQSFRPIEMTTLRPVDGCKAYLSIRK